MKLLALVSLVFWAHSALALEKITLQLKWTHAFQFAGYYAAVEKGYYQEAGLNVELLQANPGEDPIQTVISGKAQYGTGNSSLLLARKAGHPVVALAVIFQHSPQVLIALDNKNILNVHDLIDKRLMFETQSDELLAYLKQEKIPIDRLTQLKHSFNTQDLIDGKVDAISAYVTNETYYLDQAGIPYHVFTPRSAGIDFYGDNLFTTEQEIEQHPARVQAMREATLRGWRYALAHPEEIADLILVKYSQNHSREFYLYEAQHMPPLLRMDLIDVGYMNPGRWRHIADTYADLGLLPRNFSLDGFLYDPNPKRDLTGLYLALGLLAAVSVIAFFIYRTNRRLARALAESEETKIALHRSEERHRLLADHASDVIWTMDLEARFTYISPSVEKLRGYSVDEVMHQSLDEALMPESLPIAVAGLGRAIAAVKASQVVPDFRGELEQPRKDGGTVWTEVTVTGIRNTSGVFVGLLGVTRDITERRLAEAQVRYMAQHDPLTDLPNRALFSDRLHHAIAGARREQKQLALMFLDLDKFKPINDSLGHAVGDVLLQAVACRMQACVRASDTVARIGGDEFVVLIASIDGVHGALAVAEKIRIALAQPFDLDKYHLSVSASIGIALYPEHGDEEIELAKHADTAMYWAKKAGRNAVRLYHP